MDEAELKPILSKDSLLSTLWSDGVLLNTTVLAPSPSKDFCQLLISADETVTVRKWKISCRKLDHLEKPKEQKRTLGEFLRDVWTQGDVERVFGEETLKQAVNIAQGHVDFLPRLPKQVLVKIIGYLPLEDIPRLSCVNKQFHELCGSDDLWERLYRIHINSRTLTAEFLAHANDVGWRSIFFSNKLQLRMKVRRGRGGVSKASPSPVRQPTIAGPATAPAVGAAGTGKSATKAGATDHAERVPGKTSTATSERKQTARSNVRTRWTHQRSRK